MDIIKRITVLLWMVAIVLIAPPVLRYFQVNPKQAVLKALFLTRPDVSNEDSRQAVDEALLNKLFSDNPDAPQAPANELLPDAHPHTMSPASVQAQPPAAPTERDKKDFKNLISGLERIGNVFTPSKNQVQEVPDQSQREPDAVHKVRWSPPPPGFTSGDTFNYLIYREVNPVTNAIKSVLDTIHGNLMLDLTPFTIITKPGKILVMLFGDKASYMGFTQRPAWSGASSDLKADSMYVLEGGSFYPLTVHELTHLYFDGYFLPTVSPLWLSEGMAVYMQINTTKQKPSWVDASMREILAGRQIPIDQLVAAQDLSSYSTNQAQLWYTQAYSLVDYLLNTRTRDEFYTFSNELKNGSPVYQALYRAYGMPFTKMTVLENVWLHDLRKKTQQNSLTSQVAQTQETSAQTSVSFPPDFEKRPAAKKTVINQLKKVPTNGYQ